MVEESSGEEIRKAVREGYARVAKQGSSCCGASSCCGGSAVDDARQLASSLGYSGEDLAALPSGANMGLSCGNPVALASIREGDVVLDLGSGGGFDAFIAGRKAGARGRVIGVDMTPEMLAKARANTAAYKESSGLDNVEFRLGEIENLPVADNSVDIVISNCVINLSADKPRVWREIARVLKPDGRVSVSDIALLQELPESVRLSLEALVGCIAGAALVDETKRMIHDAGLINAEFGYSPGYVDAMADWSDPVFRELKSLLPGGKKPADFLASLSIIARKPAG